MSKQDPNKAFSFEYDEQGTTEVSNQIMNSYNSGFIGQDFAVRNEDEAQYTEE
ncbi:hypothetical protein P9D43_06485 [Neobacillus niacini]|uniref:hypothetical protein n=1 Tax=Neobacillus niacini TaxID=86668 RepID=UPI000B2A65D8|nr:hypothetical protein [Neobacillus niacini]MEC1521676.1 hypothetical protein [Neobacillus niacini]